jgi:pimeloyl-ACP methyl ester carboxylesterase
MAIVSNAPITARLRLRSGLHLKVVDRGPIDGRPVLMLHGWSDSAWSFSRVLPLLAPDIRAIVPDQRGQGDSDRPLQGYEMSSLAGDAIDLLDALEMPRATIVGHSMGGFVAHHLAAIAPERVERLILVSSAMDPRVESVTTLREMVDAIIDPVDPLFVRNFQASTLANDVPEPFFHQVLEESLKLPARVWKALYRGFVDTEPADPRLVTCPVDVLWGDLDQFFAREDEERTVRAHPGARLTVLEGVGHALHWEEPQALARLLA